MHVNISHVCPRLKKEEEEEKEEFLHMETGTVKLKALVYDILHPASAISDYAIGVQMAVSLRKTTQIMSGISFITAYASTNKTKTI